MRAFFRHAHDLVGDSVGLLFVAVAWLIYGQLALEQVRPLAEQFLPAALDALATARNDLTATGTLALEKWR
jgi:hypothetical protein